MIQKFIPVLIAGLIVTGCVGADHFTTTGSGSTTSSTSGTTTGTLTSISSCADVAGYASLSACKSATYAQCLPTVKVVQNQTAVCYFPPTGWESCPTNPSAWSYGAWSNYCVESSGVYLRTRTATCQRTAAACDCITDSVASDRCSIGNTSYATCPFTQTAANSLFVCGTQGTPTPTATPTSTPSWCNKVFLNYQIGGNNSESVLRDANNSRYSSIVSTFNSKGYKLTNIRSSSYALSAIGAITDADRASSYVVQFEASSSGCFLGKKVSMTTRLYRAGVELTNGSETTACISLGDETGRAVDRAISRMNIPLCQ